MDAKKHFKKLMNEIGCEYSADKADNMTQAEMVEECKYQLEKYYSVGNSYHDLRYDEPKVWKSDVGKLKRFIRKYE